MQKRRVFVSLVIVFLISIIIPLAFAAQLESHSYIRANGKIVADNFYNGTTTQIYYYHYDALGNLVSTTDSIGNVVESQRIEAFGNELSKTKTANVTERSFIGKEKDSNSLFYFGARYYDASLGRFISTDPLSGKQTSPETQNKYSYAVNNPLKYVDLNGKETGVPGEAYQIPGAQAATEYYANLANQPELWKQAVGQTGGFFSSLGMNPLKTATALAGGYVAGVAATAEVVASTVVTSSVTATEVAATTGGAAIVGETIQVASQVAPKIAAQTSLTTQSGMMEIAPATQQIIQKAPQAMQMTEEIIGQTVASTAGEIPAYTQNAMAGIKQIQMAKEAYIRLLDTALKTGNTQVYFEVLDALSK